MLRSRLLPFLLLALLSCVSLAAADTLTLGGTLTSDGSAVGSGDTVITDPNTIVYGSSFSLTLNYDPASYTVSGSTYTLTNATLDFALGGNAFSYSSAAGNYLSVSLPGAYGTGTISFLVCSAQSSCFSDDYLDLYYLGTTSGLSTLATDASGWTGDPSASPSQFEFLRNFADGSQTDLQGTLATPSGSTSGGGNNGGGGGTPVPEPASLTLAVAGLGLASWRGKKISGR